MISIQKPAYGEEFRTVEFRRADGRGMLNEDETVTAAEVLATDRQTGDDMTADMISNVAPYADTHVRYKLKGGTKGKRYFLYVRCTSSNGQKFEETIELTVT